MGMSASQGRFLMLTAQKNNNEYQAQRITFERSIMAQETIGWVNEYEDQMMDKVLLFNQQDSDQVNYLSRLSYEDITGSDPTQLGLTLVSTAGKIIVPELPSDEEMQSQGKTRDDYMLVPDVKNLDFIETNLRAGNFVLASKRQSENGEELKGKDQWDMKNFSQISVIQDVADETNDQQAQSTYDKRMASFQQKDKMLELQLKQLESEHKALETEIDSVKNVIKNNVETSFKTFG